MSIPRLRARRGRSPRGGLLRSAEQIDSRCLGAPVLVGQVDRVGRTIARRKVSGRSFPIALARLLGGLNRVGLRDVKDRGEFANPETAAFLLLVGVRVSLFLALRWNPGRHLDAMLPAAHL